MLAEGEIILFLKTVAYNIYSSSEALGFERYLTEDFQNPKEQMEFSIRMAQPGDIEYLLESDIHKVEIRLKAYQKKLAERYFNECYIAVDSEQKPIFMQCLMQAEHNDLIQKHFGEVFPILSADEALLEGAFLKPEYRGHNLMSAAVSRILDDAVKKNKVNRVVTFVPTDSIASLKGIHRAGFKPYLLRKERCLFFQRKVSFEEIPLQKLKKYKESVGSHG